VLLSKNLLKKIFFRKDFNSQENKKNLLERNLNLLGLVLLGIGAIVGTGIFVSPGIVAGVYAGPGAILSFLFAAIVCMLVAFCYAEFSSTIPVGGSAYVYVYSTFGQLMAWLAGWSIIIYSIVSSATVSVAWSSYFRNLFNLNFGTKFDIIATLLIFILTLFLLRGMKDSAMLNNIMVFVKFFIIMFFIGVGIFFIKGENFSPFIPEYFKDSNNIKHYGILGVISGAASCFYSYLGFEVVATTSEEVKNPKRDVPLGIILSLTVAAILYILMTTVLVGMVDYKDLLDPKIQSYSAAYAMKSVGKVWVANIISIGAIAGMTTVALLNLYAGTRLILAISRDGLLPKKFSELSEKRKIPILATCFVGILTAIAANFLSLEAAIEVVSSCALFVFSLVSIGILFLRYDNKFKNLEKSFKVPLFPVTPILAFVTCILLMTRFKKLTWIIFLSCQLIGIIYYLIYLFVSQKNINSEKNNNQ
jgi:APA family basic amino acid/polyamine antiporter